LGLQPVVGIPRSCLETLELLGRESANTTLVNCPDRHCSEVLAADGPSPFYSPLSITNKAYAALLVIQREKRLFCKAFDQTDNIEETSWKTFLSAERMTLRGDIL